jgi:hypothetical protein
LIRQTHLRASWTSFINPFALFHCHLLHQNNPGFSRVGEEIHGVFHHKQKDFSK